MSSKPILSQVLFIFLNLLFLSLLVNCTRNCNNPPDHSSKHKHKHKHHKHKSSSPSSPSPPTPETPKLPPFFPGNPKPPPFAFPPGTPKVPGFPLPTSPPFAFPPRSPKVPGFPLPTSPPFAFPPRTPKVPGFPLPTSPPFAFPPGTPQVPGFPLPRISPPLPGTQTCPRDALKFGACGKVLGGLIGGEVGTAPKQPCCSLFGGLVEAEAAVCLCTAIKANVLGFNLDVPVAMSMVLNVCEMRTPPNFQCS